MLEEKKGGAAVASVIAAVYCLNTLLFATGCRTTSHLHLDTGVGATIESVQPVSPSPSLEVITQPVSASPNTEPEWVDYLAGEIGCDPTQVEVRIATGTRVDLLNDRYAIEADWADKWAEGCGQALYYSACTGRQAGLLLLLKNESQRRYVERAAVVCAKHGIAMWVYDCEDRRWDRMFQRSNDQ